MSIKCAGGNDTNIKWCGHRSDILGSSVADPHHADPDPACHFAEDPDPACRFDADLDPDPSFQIKAQNLKKCSNRFIFQYIWACHLLIDAVPDPAYHFDADPNPTFQFDADPCGSETLLGWI
jgi:hypothetical protein